MDRRLPFWHVLACCRHQHCHPALPTLQPCPTMFHRQELLRRGHTVDETQELLQTSDAGMYVWGAHDREAPAVACDSIECLNFARTVAFSHYLQGMYDGWQPPRRCVRC